MTGVEHYQRAERLLTGPYRDADTSAMAQAHAILALTAATALYTINGGVSPETRAAWGEVTT